MLWQNTFGKKCIQLCLLQEVLEPSICKCAFEIHDFRIFSFVFPKLIWPGSLFSYLGVSKTLSSVEDSLGKSERFLLTKAVSFTLSFHKANCQRKYSVTHPTLLGHQASLSFTFFLPFKVIKNSQKFPQCFAILDLTSFCANVLFCSSVQSCIPPCI